LSETAGPRGAEKGLLRPIWRWLDHSVRDRRLPARVGDIRALHVGGYWRGPNDIVRHMMLGLRAAGAAVLELSTDDHPEIYDTEGRPYDRGTTGPVWLRPEGLDPWVSRFEPNLLVCNAGGLALRAAHADRLRRRAFLLGVALSDPDVFEVTTRHIAREFDAFLTNHEPCVPLYQALGASSAAMPIGTNPDYFHPAPPRPEMRCDVLMLGGAHPDRVEPVKALLANFETHVYGERWEGHGIASRGLIFGDDVLAALNSARLSVIFNRTTGGHAVVKTGLFDFTAAGALVATNHSPATARCFRFGREVLGFSSTGDLLDVVRHTLRHRGESERVRLAGRRRTLRDHTWRAIWPRVLARVARV
jgi:hypothetical protein